MLSWWTLHNSEGSARCIFIKIYVKKPFSVFSTSYIVLLNFLSKKKNKNCGFTTGKYSVLLIFFVTLSLF